MKSMYCADFFSFSRVLSLLLLSGMFFNGAARVVPTKNKAAKATIEKLYEDINGFVIDGAETEKITKDGGAPTYGEITFEALETLLNDLHLNKNDCFLDLGCGVGKTCVQVALTTPAQSRGVELSTTRVKNAQGVAKKMAAVNADAHQRLTFQEGDISKVDYKPATVVYMCSTCFSDELMHKIADGIEKLPGGTRLITLKELPERSRFVLEKTYNLPMTWSSSTPVYRYRLKKKESIEPFMNRLYNDVNGFLISSDEVEKIKKEGGDATYGEITYKGVKMLLDDLKLTKDDYFLDLGSGVGKACMQVVLTTPAHARGVELSETRSRDAQKMKDALEESEYAEAAQRLIYQKGDITKVAYAPATVVFMASTCFSKKLMNTVADKLEKLPAGTRIITFEKLPERATFKFDKKYVLPMSWTQELPVYRYHVVKN